MPIYEFYCPECNTLFDFFSRKIDTLTHPPCPQCRAPLSREVSQIGVLHGDAPEDGDGLGHAAMDDGRVEKALASFGDSLDAAGKTDDPKKAAELLSQFSDAAGIKFNPEIQDTLRRAAEGADPDAALRDIDAIIASGDTPFSDGTKPRRAPPRKDPVLHDLI